MGGMNIKGKGGNTNDRKSKDASSENKEPFKGKELLPPLTAEQEALDSPCAGPYNESRNGITPLDTGVEIGEYTLTYRGRTETGIQVDVESSDGNVTECNVELGENIIPLPEYGTEKVEKWQKKQLKITVDSFNAMGAILIVAVEDV